MTPPVIHDHSSTVHSSRLITPSTYDFLKHEHEMTPPAFQAARDLDIAPTLQRRRMAEPELRLECAYARTRVETLPAPSLIRACVGLKNTLDDGHHYRTLPATPKSIHFLFFANRCTKILLPHDSFLTAGKRDLTYIPESGPQKSGNEKTATVTDITFPGKIVPKVGPHLQGHVPLPGPVRSFFFGSLFWTQNPARKKCARPGSFCRCWKGPGLMTIMHHHHCVHHTLHTQAPVTVKCVPGEASGATAVSLMEGTAGKGLGVQVTQWLVGFRPRETCSCWRISVNGAQLNFANSLADPIVRCIDFPNPSGPQLGRSSWEPISVWIP